MPQLTWSETALRNISRLHNFFASESRPAAVRAIQTIRQGIKALAAHPEAGIPVEDLLPGFREGIIEFGDGAYVALYHFYGKHVVILAVRHGHAAELT